MKCAKIYLGAMLCILLVNLKLIFSFLNSATQTAQINSKTASHNVLYVSSFGGQRWSDFEVLKPKILGPVSILQYLGPYQEESVLDKEVDEKQRNFKLNLGKALDTLRRDLPMVFYTTNLDFSVFANQITVGDGNQNKIVMQRTLYSTIVKSMRMAASLSAMCPSMNVKKIEYLEGARMIQCLVDVVLPDTVRVDGQAMWEGWFYFGLNPDGLIDTHVFDRKVSSFRPQLLSARSIPWFLSYPAWSAAAGASAESTHKRVPAYAMLSESLLSALSFSGKGKKDSSEEQVLDDEELPMVLRLLHVAVPAGEESNGSL